MMNRTEAFKGWISEHVEKEEEDSAYADIVASIVIIVISVLIGSYYLAHQTQSTGFFTEAFGSLEIVLFYGFLVYWIVTSALILLGYKNPSRDLDSFGGLIFATVSIVWLFAVFPFEFNYFADVMPDSLRFLVQWISNDIARVLMVPAFIIHLGFAVVTAVLRVSIYRARARTT